MKRTTYQVPELRDENDNIIQDGTFGKHSAFSNATNDGAFDYILNNLEALRDNINGSRIYVKNKDALTTPGDISAMYIAEDTGKWYLWDGTKYIETDNARKIADEAIAARDAAKASANDAANSAREQQADWNVTDSTSKAFIKNKPINLVNIGNSPTFNLINFYKDNNDGYPVYFLMHELVQYNPDKPTFPIREVYGFNGMVFSEVRIGNGGNQFLAMVKVGLGYEPYDIYSSSTHYSPVVLKDETNNKYYWAMRINGSYQRVYMFGTFSAPPLMTAILSVDIDGNLPEGWSLVHTAKQYPFNNTIVSNANMDKLGNPIDTTYLKKSDAATSLTTNTLTATDATFTGQTSVPTANAGNSSKAIANTEFVAKSISALVNGAPDQLNTLNELAKALDNDANFSATITAELAKKLNSAEAESTYLPAVVGVVQAFAGTTIPNGWLLCDGSAVSRTDYAALYAVIGTTYGAGNGSTTFNLPNLIDKFVEGSATAGTVKSAGLPNITGTFGRNYTWPDYITANGAVSEQHYATNYYPYKQSTESGAAVNYSLDASRSSSVYGKSTTVQPPALTMRYIIKY